MKNPITQYKRSMIIDTKKKHALKTTEEVH